MNKKSLYSLAVILLILSLACNLPVALPFGGVNIEGDPEEMLAQWQEDDIKMGNFTQFDMDQDGDDGYFYDFPQEMLLDGVTLQEIAIMDNQAGSDYQRFWMYRMWNENPQEMSFELVVELPKAFSASADNIEFSIPPMEVIDPDPKFRFGFTLKAESPPDSVLDAYANDGDVPAGEDIGSVFGEMVIDTAVDKCIKKIEVEYEGWDKRWIQSERDKCRLNAANDFSGVVSSEKLDKVCDDISTLGYLNVCRAMARTDYSYCQKGKPETTFRYLCDYVYITSVCKNKPVETRDLCYAEGALAVKSTQGCVSIEDDDIRNDCYARVKKDTAFCDYINDTELKAQCLALVKGEKQATLSSVAADESDTASTEGPGQTESDSEKNEGLEEDESDSESTEDPGEAGNDIFGPGGLFGGNDGSENGEGNGWFSEETADEVCATIANQIGMASSEGHANIGHLLCNLSMNNGADGWPGTVYIWFMNTEAEMKASWDSLADSLRYTKDIPNQVYAEHTEDTDLVVAKQQDYSQENKWVYYISAAHLYKNGKIVYTHGSLEEDKRENWNYIMSVGRDFIDSVGFR